MIATVRALEKTDQDEQDDIPVALQANLRRIELDVTEGEASLKTKVDKAASVWGRIDVLVNNAGKRLYRSRSSSLPPPDRLPLS